MGKPRQRTAPDGIVVIDKPSGMTSHDVVSRLRRVYGTRAVGHAGTLDPMATGVLVIGIERGTKLLGHLMASQKRYLATMRLGVSTNTEDADGEVTGTASTSAVTDDDIRFAASAFVGAIQQVPSAVSAIKVKGVRAYTLARAGKAVELAARPVTISSLDVLAIRRHDDVIDVDLDVACSSGTYIRALARDIGARLNVGAHLTALRRTESGCFTLADAYALPADGEEPRAIIALRDVLQREFAVAQLDAEEAELVRHGMRIRTDVRADGLTGLLDVDGSVLALAEAREGQWQYRAVLSS